MRFNFNYSFLVVLVLFSCKEQEEEKPKVIYEESATKVEAKVDTTQIRVADLPVHMEGTSY